MPGPSPSAHQVLVYSGPGVSPLSLSHTLLTLSLILLPHYTVQPITPSTLATQPWEPSCALLVIPGGRDLPYVDELQVKSRVTKRIKEFIHQGGKYLGICAGAYFASREVRFDAGGEQEVVGKRDLDFFPGACIGPTFPQFAYASESGSRAVSLVLESAASSSKQTLDHIYYNGGGHFDLRPEHSSTVKVLARYASEPSATSDGADGQVAAVLCKVGDGTAVLCSVHYEYPLNEPPARDAISRLSDPPSVEQVAESEKGRIQWAEEILSLLGLTPAGRRGNDPAHQIGLGEIDEDPTLLLHPTHPSPIFVLSHPSLPDAAACFDTPAISRRLGLGNGKQILRDGNDQLHISSTSSVPEAESSHDGLTRYLAKHRRSPPLLPPPVSDLSLSSDSEPKLPQPPDFDSVPKVVILPSSSVTYTSRWTPLFNFDTYWTELDTARRKSGRKSGSLRKDTVEGGQRVAVGDRLWYAETVTSTQTMLDRNPLLLTSLPAPLTFLASFQLTGRGRGSNIWLSPAGCLQFSILLSLPSSMSSKLVFIQYLMALAVCEAVDDDGRLGVRIKWPNDIYAEVEGVGGTEVGSGKKGKAKLGGILVNTNLVNGRWRVVIGTGVNILNALPTTSIAQLHSLLTSRKPTSDKPLPVAPTMEGVFAKIMNAFEIKWEQFLEDGGFEGFMDEYLGRWLHTDQEVTLTTTEPHTRLRIQTITPDYGLLRCVPISQASTRSSGLTPLYDRGDFGEEDRIPSNKPKGEEKYVDLQPDGNSFDLMSGLIKKKT